MKTVIATSLVLMMASLSARAEEKKDAVPAASAKLPHGFEPAPPSFRVHITVHSYEGEKETTSSYVGVALLGDTERIQVGEEVPVAVTTFQAVSGKDSSTFAPATSFQYRNVGTNLLFTVREHRGNPNVRLRQKDIVVYPVELNLEHSTLGKSVGVSQGINVPSFFTASTRVALMARPGQSYHVATLYDSQGRQVLKADFMMEALE